MALFGIRDWTQWAAWVDLLFIWKQKYSLPTGGNCFVLCNSTDAIGSVVINGVKRGGVDVAWTLWFFLWCYTWVDVIHIWGVVLVLIYSAVFIIKVRWDGFSCQIVCRWCMISEEDKTGFLTVGVDIFDRLYLKEQPIFFPMVKISTIKRRYKNEDKWENSTKTEIWDVFYEWSKFYVWLSPPLEKSKNVNPLILMNV